MTAVLAIVAGVLLPVLARTREQGRRSACLSRLRQIGQAHLLYLQDWDERCSPWAFSTGSPVGPSEFPFNSWPPVDATPNGRWTSYLQPYLRSERVLHDLTGAFTATPAERHAEYALLTWGPGGRRTRERPYWRWAGPGLSLGEVVRPAETLLLVEGVTTAGVAWREAGRHGDGANVAFIDGHAAWLATRAFERSDSDGQGRHWLRYGAADR